MAQIIDGKISKDGRLFIPASLRCAMELPEGGKVELTLDNQTIRVTSKQQRIEQALVEIHAAIPQKVKRQVVKGEYASDDLIQQRRQENHD